LGAITYFQHTRIGFVTRATTFRVLRHKAKGL